MTRIEKSVIVDAPVHAVFAYASDWRRWPEWFEGVSDLQPKSEITRGTGARYAYRARLMGVSAQVETEVRGFVEDWGWTGVATGGLPHRTQWRFEARGESTKLTYALEYELPVPLLGAVVDSLVLKEQWRRVIGRSLANLRGRFGPSGSRRPATANGGRGLGE
jgi:uncharacterized membrane protein